MNLPYLPDSEYETDQVLCVSLQYSTAVKQRAGQGEHAAGQGKALSLL